VNLNFPSRRRSSGAHGVPLNAASHRNSWVLGVLLGLVTGHCGSALRSRVPHLRSTHPNDGALVLRAAVVILSVSRGQTHHDVHGLLTRHTEGECCRGANSFRWSNRRGNRAKLGALHGRISTVAPIFVFYVVLYRFAFGSACTRRLRF